MYLQRLMSLFGGQVLEMLLGVIIASLSVRFFGAEIIGQVSLIFAVIGLASVVSGLGFSNYFIKSVAQGKNLSVYFSGFSVLQLIGLTTFLLIGIGVWYGQLWNDTEWVIGGLALAYFCLLAAVETISTIFAARQEYVKLSVQRLAGLTARLIALALLVVWWRNATGFAVLALVEIVVQLLTNLAYMRRIQWRFIRVSRNLLTRYVRYTLPFVFSTITSRFFIHFDKVIIGWFFDPLAVGLLVMSQALFSPFDALIKTITSTAFPKITRDTLMTDLQQRQRFRDLVYFHLLVGGVLAILLLGWAEVAIQLIFGQPYPLVALTGKLFVIVIFGKMLLRPYASLLMALEKHHFYQYMVSLLHPWLKLGFYALLIPSALGPVSLGGLGIKGIPLVTGGLWFILILPLTYVSLRRVGSFYYLGDSVRLLASIVLSLGMGYVMADVILPFDSLWLHAIVFTAISTMSLMAFAYWQGALSAQTWQTVKHAVLTFRSFVRQEFSSTSG